MTANNNSRDVINMDELKEIMDEDMELIHECFNEFVKDWPEIYVELKSSILKKDAVSINAVAHKLKGILKYLAAPKGADAANSLEAAGQEKNFQDIENKLETLKNECQKIIGYINEFNQ